MESWEAYQMYLGLKLHFTSDYDYKRYGGKTSASKASFLKRKDRNFFSRVARKYEGKELDFFLSNFIKQPKGYIGDFKEENYIEWSKNQQSLTYNFIKDMSHLVSQESFDNIFKCESGKHPTLIKSYLAKRISLETMVILQSLVNYMKQFDKDVLHWQNYDLVVINDDFEKCYKKIIDYINSNLKKDNLEKYNKDVISDHVASLLQ